MRTQTRCAPRWVDWDGDGILDGDCAKWFSNYDVSFHNELWSSTFYGSWAAASTWQWERVFGWPDANLDPPPDLQNLYETQHSSNPGVTNLLDIGLGYPIPVINKTLFHHFAKIKDLLTNPNWIGLDFLNGAYSPHYAYDAANDLECYYLQDDAGLMAIGWVHNVNAYWENNFYLTKDESNLLGCLSPTAQQIVIPGFQPGIDFNVSFFPTRLNSAIYPDGYVDQSGTGDVLLDLSTAPFNGIANDYLDTLHADYAFIVALNPVPKNLITSTNDNITQEAWDFSLFPNPARSVFNILLPHDKHEKNIAIYDTAGKQISTLNTKGMPLVSISTDNMAKGIYCIRVSDGTVTRMKSLIVH